MENEINSILYFRDEHLSIYGRELSCKVIIAVAIILDCDDLAFITNKSR